MNYNTIKQIMETVKPGVFTRISYDTELPMKAEYRKAGYRIIKHTSTTTRFKLNYTKLASYTPSNSQKKSSYITLVPNLFYECSKNGNRYISMFPCKKGRNTKVSYTCIFPDGAMIDYDGDSFTDADRDLIIDSYWKKSAAESTNYKRINIDNIVSIGSNK